MIGFYMAVNELYCGCNNVYIKDGKHGWPTEELNSFSVNKLILEFFENRR
jgi:hypothetical protein